jgi:hypothetical protein
MPIALIIRRLRRRRERREENAKDKGDAHDPKEEVKPQSKSSDESYGTKELNTNYEK